MFVIISQLTGVGLDNYGVKKILPKLIIAVILVNVSYILCQLCIDVANLVGGSIKEIFTNIGKLDTGSIVLYESQQGSGIPGA